jgi:transmembrane sensor
MSNPFSRSTESDRIERLAYAWVQRESGGLSAREMNELKIWLEADFRHAAAFEEYKYGWDRFREYAETVGSSIPAVSHPWDSSTNEAGAFSSLKGSWPRSLRRCAAAAAALYLGVFAWKYLPVSEETTPAPAPAPIILPALCEQRTLADGSVVVLNRGADVTVQFTAAERRVRLVRGEASFTVAKNPLRPFIVSAGSVEVRAVGTVFNVNYNATAVAVVVSEGKVRVDQHLASSPMVAQPPSSYVIAGQAEIVPLAAKVPAPKVVTLDSSVLETDLLWQPKLLNFDNARLRDIVAEFNRRNSVHLVFDNEITGARRMTATFRSDNVEGFVRLLISDFGYKIASPDGKEIHLTR